MQKIHFISIGGAVMHNLALALHLKGYQVTGSDDEVYDPAKSRLQKVGLLPTEIGWFPEKITADLDAVILGMHARIDNPELLKAQALGLKIYSFPEYIYEQSKNKQRIVIAGSHGKTSITSIILHVLKYWNRKFDYLVGAQIEGFDVMVQLSDDAPIIVIEGDEYPESKIHLKSKFLFYHPHIALISGIAWDHFNIFPTFDSYIKPFEELIDGIPKAGSMIYDETDEALNIIAERENPDVAKKPYKAHAHKVVNGKTFLITAQGDVPLHIFGEHNMKNLNGAKIILDKVGITDEMFYEAIQKFTGAAKRLEKLGENHHTLLYRDFAHAPSKLKATVEAMQQLYPSRQLIACYEIHTYSSLDKTFLPQYKNTLDSADVAVLFYSPKTLEIKKMEPISPEEIRKAFGREDLEVFTDAEALENFLMAQNFADTSVLMMSSGTFGGTNLQELSDKILAVSEKTPTEKLTIAGQFKKKTWVGRQLFKK